MKSIKLSLAMLCAIGTIHSGNIFFQAGPRDPNAPVRSGLVKRLTKLPKRAFIPGCIIALAYGQCMTEKNNSTAEITTKDVIDKSYVILQNTWLGLSTLALSGANKVKQYLPTEALALFEKQEQSAAKPSTHSAAPSSLPGSNSAVVATHGNGDGQPEQGSQL